MSKESTHAYACFQQGAERLKAAMAGLPNRIPVSAQMHDFVAAQRGIPRRKFFTNPEIMMPAILEVQAEYGLNVASVTFDVYNIEAEGLGQKMVWSDASMPDVDGTEHKEIERLARRYDEEHLQGPGGEPESRDRHAAQR